MLEVYGHVQGVGFRYTCLEQARRLHLTGYAKNKSDGSVEIVLQGEQKFIAEFQQNLQKRFLFPGSISRISCKESSGEYTRFSIY